ncbi:cellulose synthase [Aliihoeflea sp. PC F10.4]
MKMRAAPIVFATGVAIFAVAAGAQNWRMNDARQAVTTTGSIPATQPFEAHEESEAPAIFAEPEPQSERGAVVAQAQQQAAPVQPLPQVDESAIRYFAQRGDTQRLEAEIARLRALYPNWTPPADPLAVPENVDERLEEMWRLYADGRLGEVRQAISRRQAEQPDWQPPADLLDRLQLSEARERLINASDLDQYQMVVRLGSEHPSLLTCSEVDVLWRVAEAFAMTERQPRARDAYRYVLTSCDNPQERLATMQNASTLLSDEYVDELLALERPGEDGQGEFTTVRDSRARDLLARAGEEPTLQVGSEILRRVERLAQDETDGSDPRLLGWYYLRRDDGAAAERWFRMALEREPNGEAAEGLALALVARDQFAEAEDTIYPYRDENDDRRAVYLAAAANLLGTEPRIALSSQVLSRIVAEAVASRDVEVARQLGWYARAYGQHETAGQWFTTALGFDPDDEPAAYGLALTRLQLGDDAGVAELRRLWTGRSERIVAVGTPMAADTGEPAPVTASAQPVRPQPQQEARRTTAAPQSTARAAAPAARQQVGCRDSVDPRTLSPATALGRGWCLMERDRPLEAAQAFDVALASADEQSRRDAAYGKSLAYLRAGLVDDAAIAAASAPMSAARGAELQSSILAERALGAFERRRYNEALIALDQRAQIAAERNDLLVLRGYAYLNLGRVSEAEQVFRAVAATGSREGLRGIAAVEQTRRGD